MKRNHAIYQSGFAALIVCLGAVVSTAARDQSRSIEHRLQGADRAVVARARTVNARWAQNAYGDQLIVSRVELQVEEVLKGSAPVSAWVDMEGGTLNGVTLSVSDMPQLRAGDRAVFFLDATADGGHVPHMRGDGVMKLDARNNVPGTALNLEDVRRAARQMKGGGR